MDSFWADGVPSHCNLMRVELQAAQTNTVSLWASGAVAPIQDLNTLKEQHREQKLLPQLLQFLLFFRTENTALQFEQFPVLVVG